MIFLSLTHASNRTTLTMWQKFQFLPYALQTNRQTNKQINKKSQLQEVTGSISSRRENANLLNPMSLFLFDIGSLSLPLIYFISSTQCAMNLSRFIHSFHFDSISLCGQSIEDEMEIILHYWADNTWL